MTLKTQTKAHELKALPIYVINTDEAQGIVEAVVNVFGIVDLGDDIIHNGAYIKTLNERGNKVRVKVLDSHNTDSVLRVIGKPLEIREIGRDELARLAPGVLNDHPDATGGLYTKTQYLLDVPEGLGAFRRIASGAVNEYSIALDALEVDYGKVMVEGKERTVRHVRQLRLWEYSPVVFGMNQATVTTDVKTSAGEAPESDKDAPAPETVKQGTLGSRLEANLRLTAAFSITDWLACGMIDAETVGLLNGAVETSMATLRQNLPTSVADMPLHDYWSAGGADERKAGRMISGTNREKIQAAIDVLQALMDASMPADNAPEDEMNDEKAQTGTDVPSTEGSTAPSIPDANSFALDAASIERELAEISLMMEMTA